MNREGMRCGDIDGSNSHRQRHIPGWPSVFLAGSPSISGREERIGDKQRDGLEKKRGGGRMWWGEKVARQPRSLLPFRAAACVSAWIGWCSNASRRISGLAVSGSTWASRAQLEAQRPHHSPQPWLRDSGLTV
jgi:hypothetical protein